MKNIDKNKIVVFSDGASKGNPGPGGFGAVVVFPDGKVIELGGSESHTTNNRMELSGALSALSAVPDNQLPIIVYTDSKYVINGMTAWIYGWQKNGWQTKDRRDVSNRDLWEKLANASKGQKIVWNYVGGHVGIAGNERCDEIADALATGQKVDLFTGSLSDYKVNIMDLGHSEEKKATKSNKNAKAYSYLSIVDGVLKIDKTWPECEARVKGKKGVRFQKSVSPENESEIIKSWGMGQ